MDSIPQNERLTSSWKSDVYDGHGLVLSISASLDGAAVEVACRTPTEILLARAFRREVRAIRRRTLSISLPHLNMTAP
ncbi:hypothetical protein [Nostoc sp.]|uniref:hypothetical protein n=1 Tax=Nostoc sp. TaxID=1180 RepID=UPI002FFAFF44